MADIANDEEAPAAEAPWPSPRLAWTALIMLMVAMMISVLDRGVINLLVEPIKGQYHLNDTQFGALTGLAFGLLYVTASMPIGFLADRFPRRIVIGIGMTMFSLFSISTGLARNYTQLFISRMGVGGGEASMSPAGLSIISDYFPRARLGRAVSLFMSSTYIGASLALVVGGTLIGSFTRLQKMQPDALFGFQPWQATIICAALPGLLLAPMFFLIREPRRRGLLGTGKPLPLRDVVRELGKRKTPLALITTGMSMASIMTLGVTMWTPALFIRVYHWSPAKVGLWLGLLTLAGGVVGGFLSGWLSDRMLQRRAPDAPITVAALSFVGVGIFGIGAPLMPTPELALLFFVPVLFLKPMAFACGPMALQLLVPNQIRGQTSGVYFTTVNLLGLAVGPIVTGAMSDYLFPGPTGVRYSLVVMTAVTVPLMILLMWAARRPYRAAVAAES